MEWNKTSNFIKTSYRQTMNMQHFITMQGICVPPVFTQGSSEEVVSCFFIFFLSFLLTMEIYWFLSSLWKQWLFRIPCFLWRKNSNRSALSTSWNNFVMWQWCLALLIWDIFVLKIVRNITCIQYKCLVQALLVALSKSPQNPPPCISSASHFNPWALARPELWGIWSSST